MAGDSTIPIVAAGFDDEVPFPEDPSVIDFAPLALSHFGVEAPASMRARVRSSV